MFNHHGHCNAGAVEGRKGDEQGMVAQVLGNFFLIVFFPLCQSIDLGSASLAGNLERRIVKGDGARRSSQTVYRFTHTAYDRVPVQ